ncbi:MAG: 2,3-bisphosphoglycerate-independent phosphoglycerate mutase [Candidatus Bathyarchaeia archaeon]
MKAILIICDGMADRPLKELRWRTPLEATKKPAMNRLARLGVSGIMDTISPGVPPGSDTAHLALLGYDPYKTYRGRGAFEAVGAGLDVKPGDVAFRFNFASMNEDMVVIDRRAGRIGGDEAARLAKSLETVCSNYSGVQVICKHTVEHRGALLLRGEGLSPEVSDSDPEEEGGKLRRVEPLRDTPEARRTAEILNDLSLSIYKALKNHPVNEERAQRGLHPANVILLRGAGTLPQITPISQLYGIKAACIVPSALVRGVAISAGMKALPLPPCADGTTGTDAKAKAKVAVENLRDYDFILIHVKGADNASHDGNLRQKQVMIRKIEGMVGFLLREVNLRDTYIALTADHATPITVRGHAGDPVPVTIAGPEVVKDGLTGYSERHCAKGGLGRIRGLDLMPILMNLLGMTRKFGA